MPEAIVDLQSIMTTLFQELHPSITVELLEMDRIHKAVTPHKSEGPPLDIIAKISFFRTKVQLLAAARGKDSLIFQDHSY